MKVFIYAEYSPFIDRHLIRWYVQPEEGDDLTSEQIKAEMDLNFKHQYNGGTIW